MTGLAGTEGIRAGDQVIVDGRPRVVLAASGTAVRFAGDDGVVEVAARWPSWRAAGGCGWRRG
jgi:hypothetical protein